MEIDNNQIQILDILGMPTNNLLFSSYNDTLVYSIGSNIIFYNLEKNTKTFLQYSTKNEISILKYADMKEKLLISIDKNSRPLLSIWELPFFEEVFSQEITTNSKFNLSNIFIEKISSNLFIILITAVDCNLLYGLKNDDENNFNLIRIGQIPNMPIEIGNFKCFYDDIYLIFLTKNYLYYYLINIQKIFNSYHSDVIKLYTKIVFPFKLDCKSLSISDKYKLISFVTYKGNCLVYNKNGESLPSINPLENNENFTISHFSGDSLCLGTNSSKIYIYNIENFKLKYFIKDKILNSIKLNFQLNNNFNKNNFGEYKNIEYLSLNEKLDKIFIKMNDNSILLAPLTSLMDDSRGLFNFNSLGNTTCLYSYNHSKLITSMDICNNYNEYETVFYTCSKDKTLMKYNIEFSSNKLSNLFFDLHEILSNNKGGELSNENSDKNNNINNNNNYSNTYLTIIKFHPFHNTKLYAGDNKGYLYIFDMSTEYFQYKKYIIDNYSIESLSFSREANLLCIGLLTGKQVIYDINKNFEFCLKLSDNYLTQSEIDLRIRNYHIITFSYFFKSQKHRDCILFSKNNKNVEYSKLFYDEKKEGKLNKKSLTLNEFENTILDIKVHISENYLIALNDKHQIIINEINLGETTAVIDLNGHVREIYNFEIDRSGLYMGVICSLNNKMNNDMNTDLILFEIGTGNIISYIKCIGMVYKIMFDYYGKFIIMAGHKGDASLWKIPQEMTNVILNVLYELEKNNDFWEQFEIKYYSNKDQNNYEIMEENKNEVKTEIPMNNVQEVEDNGPHKGIQTNLLNNDLNNINNNINNINDGNKIINSSNNILNSLNNDIKPENFDNNSNTFISNNNISKNNISKNIPNNISNINNSKNYNNKNESFNMSNNFRNRQFDTNKTISLKNNNNINKYNNNNRLNSLITFNKSKNDNLNNNNFNINSENIKKNKNYNNTSNINTNYNTLSNVYDNFNNNLKNENTLQSCYEKFKKERLMKNSLLNTANKINKSKDKNRYRNLYSNNLFNSKNQNLKSKKLNSLSTPKISTSKNYLKGNSQMNNINSMNSKLKFNKNEEDEIDFDIDFDVNKIRPNFDPNLYTTQSNQKYSQAAKELIQPFLTSNYERNEPRRYNNIQNGNQILSDEFSYSNNNMNENINDNKYMNSNMKSKNESPIKSYKSDRNDKINKAMKILLNNNNINSNENNNMNMNNNRNNIIKNNINNNINNNIISTSKIENQSETNYENFFFINNNKFQKNAEDSKENNNTNNNFNKKSISSRDISQDFAYINNMKMEENSINKNSNNYKNYENNSNHFLNYSRDNENNNYNKVSNNNMKESVDIDANLINNNNNDNLLNNK